MCDAASQQDGWTGFYGARLAVRNNNTAESHPLIADYGLDRSSLWGQKTPESLATSWCAFPGDRTGSWGARAYVLKPNFSGCRTPARRHGDDHSYWATPGHRLAYDFEQFVLMNRTIRFNVDLHEVGCGAVLTLYLAGLPAVDSSFEPYPQQSKETAAQNPGRFRHRVAPARTHVCSMPTRPTAAGSGCASQEYYADANPELTGCESLGFEFDLFEGNVASMHTTAHGCLTGVPVPGSDVRCRKGPFRQPSVG